MKNWTWSKIFWNMEFFKERRILGGKKWEKVKS
jgi:hypothetical protein